MPGKPSRMQTSAGNCGDIRGVGFAGHGARVGDGAAEPVMTSSARAPTPTAPAIDVDRVAVMCEEDYNPRMAVLSRREFGGVLIAGLPFAVAMRSRALSAAADVAVGV